MPYRKLAKALASVDWNANVVAFLKEKKSGRVLAEGNLRLAIWAKQLEIADMHNVALPFIREMQVAGHQVAALTSLALYKPAASAMRSMLESALYYTYFRTHPVELATLVRDQDFFMERREVVEYHLRHTPDFRQLQLRFSLLESMKRWYRDVSVIVHGQIPGGWVEHTALAEIRHVSRINKAVVKAFAEGVRIVHGLLLCTVGRDLWHSIASDAKKELLAGLSGDIKKALELDTA